MPDERANARNPGRAQFSNLGSNKLVFVRS